MTALFSLSKSQLFVDLYCSRMENSNQHLSIYTIKVRIFRSVSISVLMKMELQDILHPLLLFSKVTGLLPVKFDGKTKTFTIDNLQFKIVASLLVFFCGITFYFDIVQYATKSLFTKNEGSELEKTFSAVRVVDFFQRIFHFIFVLSILEISLRKQTVATLNKLISC